MTTINNQTHTMSNTGSHPFQTVRGHGFGLAKSNLQYDGIGAIAYGHDIPIGRIVVASALHNGKADKHSQSFLSASLPDATGDYTVDSINGLALSNAANATLLSRVKVGGQYIVLGVVVEGEDCFSCDCAPCDNKYPACPVGNGDTYMRELVGRNKSTVTIATKRAYVRVPCADDLDAGDKLALIDAPDGEPCLNLLGSVVAADDGAQNLPDNWVVVEPAEAGKDVLIYLGA